MNSKNFSEDFNDTVVTSIIGHIQNNNFSDLKENLSNHDFLSHSLSTFKHLDNSFDIDHYLFLLKNDPFVYSLLNEKEEFMDYMLDNYIINPNSRMNIQSIFGDSVLDAIETYIEGKYEEFDIDENIFVYEDSYKDIKLSSFAKLIGEIGLIDKSIAEKYFNKLKSLEATYLEKMNIVEQEVYYYKLEYKNNFLASNTYGTFGGMLTELIIKTNFEALSPDFDFSSFVPEKHKVLCYYDDYMNSQRMNVELPPVTGDFYDFNKDYNNDLVYNLKGGSVSDELKKEVVQYLKENRLMLIKHYMNRVDFHYDEYNYLSSLEEKCEEHNEEIQYLEDGYIKENTRKM